MRRRQSRGLSRRYIFMLTGFGQTEKTYLLERIRTLGGNCSKDEQGFDRNCTHIICKKPSRSEKFLAGCATGKWLVSAGFVEDSFRHGRWVEEAQYEWCDSDRWRACIAAELHALLAAPRRWRLQHATGSRPFRGWRTAVCVDNVAKSTVYTRLLELGGAIVETLSIPLPRRSLWGESILSLTHVFVDEKNILKIVPLLRNNIFCLEPVYIGDFLVQPSAPDPMKYLVGHLGPPSSGPSTPRTPSQISSLVCSSGSMQEKQTRASVKDCLPVENAGVRTANECGSGVSVARKIDGGGVKKVAPGSACKAIQRCGSGSDPAVVASSCSQPVSKTAPGLKSTGLPLSQPIRRTRSNSLSSNHSAESDSCFQVKGRSFRRKTISAVPTSKVPASSKNSKRGRVLIQTPQNNMEFDDEDFAEARVVVVDIARSSLSDGVGSTSKWQPGRGTQHTRQAAGEQLISCSRGDGVMLAKTQGSIRANRGVGRVLNSVENSTLTSSPQGSRENPIVIEEKKTAVKRDNVSSSQGRRPTHSQAPTPARAAFRGRKFTSKDSPSMQRFSQGTLRSFIKAKTSGPSCTIRQPPSPPASDVTPSSQITVSVQNSALDALPKDNAVENCVGCNKTRVAEQKGKDLGRGTSGADTVFLNPDSRNQSEASPPESCKQTGISLVQTSCVSIAKHPTGRSVNRVQPIETRCSKRHPDKVMTEVTARTGSCTSARGVITMPGASNENTSDFQQGMQEKVLLSNNNKSTDYVIKKLLPKVDGLCETAARLDSPVKTSQGNTLQTVKPLRENSVQRLADSKDSPAELTTILENIADLIENSPGRPNPGNIFSKISGLLDKPSVKHVVDSACNSDRVHYEKAIVNSSEENGSVACDPVLNRTPEIVTGDEVKDVASGRQSRDLDAPKNVDVAVDVQAALKPSKPEVTSSVSCAAGVGAQNKSSRRRVVLAPLEGQGRSPTGPDAEREGMERKRKLPERPVVDPSLSKKAKLMSSLARLPWVTDHSDTVRDCLRTKEPATGVLALPSAEAYTGIVEGLVEDGFYSQAVDMIDGCLSSASYPQPALMRILVHQILMSSDSELLSMKAYNVLCRCLVQHPPTCPALQHVYMGALEGGDGYSVSQLWGQLKSVFRNAVAEVQENGPAGALNRSSQQVPSTGPLNSVLRLRFYTDFFEKDFRAFLTRYHNKGASLSQGHGCALSQLLWPGGSLATGHFNTACQDLLKILFDVLKMESFPQRFHLINCIQSVLAIAVEICWYSDHCHSNQESIHLYRGSAKTAIFAKELAMTSRACLDCDQLELFLTTLRLPWLTALVCEEMLEFYDESLLPLTTDKNKSLSLKEIIQKHFFLLPPLTSSNASMSPHKKRRRKLDFSERQGVGGQSQGVLTNALKDSSNQNADTLSRGSACVKMAGKGEQENSTTTAMKRRMSSVNKQNNKGETQLHRACLSNNMTKVKDLLQVPGIDVNIGDFAGWTPLHEACNKGHVGVVRELLNYRPAKTLYNFFHKGTPECKRVDLLAASEEEGLTPLHDAVQNNNMEVARLLLQYGGEALLNARCRQGKTPLEYADTADMRDLLEKALSHPLTTPSKRKYLPAGSQSQDSQLSQLSQSSFLSSSDTSLHANCGYQPPAELYTEVLESHTEMYESGSERKHVDTTELNTYCVIVYHLLKNYIMVEDLMKLSLKRKTGKVALPVSHKLPVGSGSQDQSNDSQSSASQTQPNASHYKSCDSVRDLEENKARGFGDDEDRGENETETAVESNVPSMSGRPRRNRVAKVIWSPSVNTKLGTLNATHSGKGILPQAGAHFTQTGLTGAQNERRNAHLFVDTSSVRSAKSNDTVLSRDCRQYVDEDCEILQELRTHVRAFQSHLRLLCQDHLGAKCKMYLAAMKCIQT